MLDRAKARLNALLVAQIDAATAALTNWRARLSGSDLGTVADATGPRDQFVEKIRLLVRLRWAVHLIVPLVLLLLGRQGLQLKTERAQDITLSTGQYLLSLWPNFALSASGLLINALYFLLLRRGRSLRPIAHAQVWLDTLIFAFVIYETGGVTSPFAFLYTMPVLAASMLLSTRASLAVATVATALLSLQAYLQVHGLLPNNKSFEAMQHLTHNSSYLAASITLNAVLYYLIAATSGVLARTIVAQAATLAKRANEATMLHEVSSSLQGLTALDDVLKKIMDTIVGRLEIDRALMYLVSEAGDALELKVVVFHPRYADVTLDDLKMRFPLARESGITAICALEKKVFNVTDPLNHPLINRDAAKRIGLNPFAVAPMLARGHVIGVIGCDRKFQRAIITQEEAQILAIAANQAGLTIQNARAFEKTLAR
jgi:K+-sensing histidine kinase KdpD